MQLKTAITPEWVPLRVRAEGPTMRTSLGLGFPGAILGAEIELLAEVARPPCGARVDPTEAWWGNSWGASLRLGFPARHRCWSQGAAWLVVLLLPSLALAVMPAWVYQEARDTAMHYVQVKVLSVKAPAKTPGDCSVTGEVVRIFRDKSATLKIGTRLEFMVSCARRSDPPLIGGTLWTDYDQLMNAKYLEVFLNKNDGRYEVALWQSRIIEAPTDEPAFGSTANIGGATMETDGAIILQLRAKDGIHRHTRLVYPPTHPKYPDLLKHLNGLKPGDWNSYL